MASYTPAGAERRGPAGDPAGSEDLHLHMAYPSPPLQLTAQSKPCLVSKHSSNRLAWLPGQKER